jgi:hypothetical protein
MKVSPPVALDPSQLHSDELKRIRLARQMPRLPGSLALLNISRLSNITGPCLCRR